MKTAKQNRSARNKAEHAARIARERPDVASRMPAIDPLDEEPMAPTRPPLRAIPYNKIALTEEQRQAVAQAILDHYPRSEIARALGISVKTLKRLLDSDPALTDAADAAKDQEEAELRDALMGMARQGSEIAALFLLKARHGYRDRDDKAIKPAGIGGVLVLPAAPESIEDFEAAAYRQQAAHRSRPIEEPTNEAFRPDTRGSTDQGHGVVMQRTRTKDLPTRH
jgi:DNA-binding CsgD family transcriptional regulator